MPGVETAAIPGPFNLIVDGFGRVSRAQKIGVLRMEDSIGWHGSHSYANTLRQYLPAIHARRLGARYFDPPRRCQLTRFFESNFNIV